jgi:hypothetical protein
MNKFFFLLCEEAVKYMTLDEFLLLKLARVALYRQNVRQQYQAASLRFYCIDRYLLLAYKTQSF